MNDDISRNVETVECVSFESMLKMYDLLHQTMKFHDWEIDKKNQTITAKLKICLKDVRFVVASHSDSS